MNENVSEVKVETGTASPDEGSHEAALADLWAGYKGKSRDTMSPDGKESAKEVTKSQPEAKDSSEQKLVEEKSNTEVADLADELKALKLRVAASSGDPDLVRRMHGEIGNINRTLKQMKERNQAAKVPVDDDLTTAIKAAEEAEKEFPEITGPLVKAIKALSAAQKTKEVAAEPSNDDSQNNAEQDQHLILTKMLSDVHPGFKDIVDSDAYQTWLSSKPQDYQTLISNTWNPVVAANALTEFKDSQKIKQKKQERLEASVVTRGVEQAPIKSVIPDEEGLWRGYNKSYKRLTNR